MRFRFMHIADIHLGYKQYNESFRADDFARAFKEVIQRAIAEKVNFVLLAGDLFHKRAIDAITLEDAYRPLERLKQSGIPCIAVEGNHEMAYYGEEGSWLGFLRQRELITLLQTRIENGTAYFDPAHKQRGSWVEPIPGVRVYGLGYKGAGAPPAIEMCALAFDALPPEARTGVDYTIFAAHTGVLGEHTGDTVSPTKAQWLSLRPFVDYVALGHIHKPFVYEDWIFNPGSLETCAADEWAWGERAALLVDVDTDQPVGPLRTRVTRVAPHRRPFARFSFKMDLHPGPESLLEKCSAEFARRRADMGDLAEIDEPVVDVILDGVLVFHPSQLGIAAIEELARASLKACIVQVKDYTVHRAAIVGGDDDDPGFQEQPRAEVERRVLQQLLSADIAFVDRADEWADAAITLKNMAIVPEPPDRIVEELAARIQAIESKAN